MTHNVSDQAEKILNRINILNNIYFEKLKTQQMSIEDFRETQTQFYFAVSFFSRPMSALISRIPDPKSRLSILHNIVEEHGDMSENAFHAHTFVEFLSSIGQKELDFSKINIWPQLRAFNSTLAAACMLDEIEVGIACLGIIERAFADISGLIADSVVANGWVTESNLVHYKLHEEIDIMHAADFFDIVEPDWHDDSKQHFIQQGLELGAYVFDRLYRDLIEHHLD